MVSAEELERRRQVVAEPKFILDVPKIDTLTFPAFVLKPDLALRLSLLYGYSDASRKFIPLKVAADGSIETTPAIPTEFAYHEVSASDTVYELNLPKIFLHFLITNDGPNDVFVAFNRTATTSDIRVKSGETLALDIQADWVSLICASGETATVRVLATR